jgi:hypothetical protein
MDRGPGRVEMTRKMSDEQDRKWKIELHPTEDQNEDADEEMVLQFVPEDENETECEIRIVGPILEDLSALGKGDMRLALEAAQNGLGFLFLDRDDHLWWVQGPGEDVLNPAAALTFVRGTDELHHPGPLPSPVDELIEDELQELLDECLGRVIG